MPWNRQMARSPIKPKKSKLKYTLILLCTVVAGAALLGISFVMSSSQSDETSEETKVAEKRLKKTNRIKKENRKTKVSQTKSVEKPKVVAPKKEMWMGREIVSTKIVTNGTDLIITRIDAEGKKHKEYTSTQKRLFKNPVDVVLAILLTTPEGAMTPPLPSLGPRSDDLFAKALKTPIEILETDTEEEKNLKQLVMAAREQMLDELESGRSVNDIIEDHCTFSDANNRFRAEAMVQYKELLAEGDQKLAEEFRAKANELITSKGGIPFKSLEEIRASRKSKFR